MIDSERLPAFSSGQRLQQGVTLLEIMLVLSVSALLFISTIKMYEQFQTTLVLSQMQENVDQLFQATADYYHVFCNPVLANQAAQAAQQNGYPMGVPFNVSSTPLPSGPIPVTISGLISTGYLSNWHPYVPMVNPAGGEAGYVVQMNPVTPPSSIPVNVCPVFVPGKPCVAITAAPSSSKSFASPPLAQISSSQAEVRTWVIQIAVHVANKKKIGGYGAVLGASCISGLSGSTVDPCTAPNASGDWLVWTRTPSAISIKKGPLYSTFQPMLREFKLQYSHDQYYELNSGYSATSSPPLAPAYYFCGG